MANEAVILELHGNKGDPVQFTVAEVTTIEKGTILKLSADPRTAIASSGAADCFAGIAAAEKVGGDGSTKVAAYTNGIFDLKCCPNVGVTLGTLVTLSGANLIRTAVAGDILTGSIVGKALETGSADEVIAVQVGGLY